MLIDSHAHISCDDLFEDVQGVVDRAIKAGVKKIVNICSDQKALKRGIEFQKKYPGVIYNVGSITPHDVEELGEEFKEFERAAKEGYLVAVGETGLDFHYEHSPKAKQVEFCKRYMRLAIETKLPVVFHCRDAFDELYALIDVVMPDYPFLMHCFTGTLEDAKNALERGGLISLSGILTFKRSEELRAVAKELPLERLMVETDAPYLAPQSMRGRKNEPAFVVETAQCLADVKGVQLEEVMKITTLNAFEFFKLVS